MKSFKTLFLCFWLCVGVALVSFTNIDTKGVSKKVSIKSDTVQFFAGVDSIKNLRAELVTIDSVKAGVCDSCYTSVKGVIVENRLMVAKISEQNYEMQQIIENNDNQLQKLRMYNRKIAYVLKRSQNQERVYYSKERDNKPLRY